MIDQQIAPVVAPVACERATARSARRLYRTCAILALLALASLLTSGGIRRPCQPAEGTSLHGAFAAMPSPDSLRIGLLNINSGHGADDTFDLARTAEALRGLDVIALNEVRGASLTRGVDQAESLGGILQLPWLFAPIERRWWRDDFGNALLASPPVHGWRRVPLPHSNVKGHGNYLEAELSFGGGTLHLLLTHVDRRRDRHAQLVKVLARFNELPAPAVLLGDLNSTAEEPLLQELLALPDIGDPLSLPTAWGERPRYDWILTRGLRVLGAGATDSPASDHPAFWVEVAP